MVFSYPTPKWVFLAINNNKCGFMPIFKIWFYETFQGNITFNLIRTPSSSFKDVFDLSECVNISPMSQAPLALVSISLRPMMYQMQAIQWASRANIDMSSVSTMALYCEYLSNFCSSLNRRNNRTVFSRCTRYVLNKHKHVCVNSLCK